MTTTTATFEELNSRCDLTVKVATEIAQEEKDFSWTQCIQMANNLINAFGVKSYKAWKQAK